MANSRKRLKNITIPARFEPHFWAGVDGRCTIAKEIRRRYELLKDHTGAESYPKDLLVQRAIFIGLQLETMECVAAERGEFDPGVYTQMVNALSGLLSKLGLERRDREAVPTLKAYVSGNGR
ncbi:MAG: hypothetical protein KY476_10685 [Planctomycetes bacterium]|nr:hypothetical protein [Planctomycetota bacterium]